MELYELARGLCELARGGSGNQYTPSAVKMTYFYYFYRGIWHKNAFHQAIVRARQNGTNDQNKAALLASGPHIIDNI